MLGLSEWGTPELGFFMNELISSLRMIRGMPFASQNWLHKHTHTWTGWAFSPSVNCNCQTNKALTDKGSSARPLHGQIAATARWQWSLHSRWNPSLPGGGRGGRERRWQIPVCILQREQLQLSYYSVSTWNYDKSGRDVLADENNKEEAEQGEVGKNELYLKLWRPILSWWKMTLKM